MGISVFFSRFFGIFYLVVGLGMLLNQEFYQKFMEDYIKNAVVVFLSGIIALMLGLVILLIHNIWAGNWAVIITLIGWCAFLKGIWIIVFPNTVSKIIKTYQKNKNMIRLHAIIAFVFGIILSFLGFFA